MKGLSALASTLDDWINPIAVKEFRQAVQNRLVITVLLLYLLVNLCVVGGYLLLSPSASAGNAGQTVFSGLTMILLITCIGFVPLYTCIRLSMERSRENVDLYFITGLGPAAIVRGKYLASMALTMLIYSTCMPFLTLTYLLRGIDLPTIFFVLAAGFVVCCTANAAGILAGSVQGSGFQRFQLIVWMLFVLPYLSLGVLSWAIGVSRSGIGFSFTSWRAWFDIGSYVLAAAFAIGLLHVLTIAAISHKASNRMMVVRFYVMGGWAVGCVLCGTSSYLNSNFQAIGVWLSCSVVGCIMMASAVIAERDDWTPRVRRTIPHNGLLRALAFVFYTGAGGGLIWCSLMFAATMLLAWSSLQWMPEGIASQLRELCKPLVAGFGFVMCYCLTVVLLRISVLKRMSLEKLPGVVFFLGLMMALVPCLIAFLISTDWLHRVAWFLLGSPFVLATDNGDAINAAQIVMEAWLGLSVLATLPWMFRQWRRFIPLSATCPVEGATARKSDE